MKTSFRHIIFLSVLLCSVFFSCEKNEENNSCTETSTRGPLFNAMRPLISTRCSGSGCHMNGESGGGHNFDADCSLVEHYDDIHSTCCVTFSMPKLPQAPLSDSEKTIISAWVNAGHSLAN